MLLLVEGASAEETVATLVAKARSGEGAECAAAIDRLGLLRAEEAIEPLKSALASADIEVRRAAIRALGRFGRDDLLPVLAAQAGDPDPRVAGEGVRALEPAGFSALPLLLDATRHPAAGVAEAALAAARRVSGVRTTSGILSEAWKAGKGDRFSFLARILASDTSPRAAGDVLRALPDDPKSAFLLVGGLDSEFEPVRDVARARLEALACRRLDDAGWREWLKREPGGPVAAWRARALSDAANPLRMAAARSLAVPDRDAVRALCECPADGPLEEVILAALPAATGLRPRSRAAWTAWWAANRDRTRLEWILSALVEPDDAPNRAFAARALARERDRRSVEFLILVGLRDSAETVRAAALESLRSLTGRPAAPADPVSWETWWKEESPRWTPAAK